MGRKRERNRERRHSSTRDERRTELLDAAVRVVRRDGPAASMDAIATEAGITKPILYRHFGDRSGLVQAVADRFAEELLAELRAAMGGEAEPRELLAATIDAYLAFIERDDRIARFIVQRTLASDEQARALSGFIEQIGREVTVTIGEQLRRVGADSGPAEPWAYGIVGMVHLAGDWWAQRRTIPRERLVEYLTDLLWGGLGSLADAGENPPETGEEEVIELRRSRS